MSALSLDDAIAQFSNFSESAKTRIEAKSVGSPDAILAVVTSFIKYSLDAGWYFDEDLNWHEFEGDAPRSSDEMVEHFKDLVFVKQDGGAARDLRDKFLSFIPGREHAPLLEGLYAVGYSVNDDGSLVSPG